jgi:hypothetical protein
VWASEIYGLNRRDKEEKFWRTRRREKIASAPAHSLDLPAVSSGDYVILYPAVKVVKTPCIVGDFIETRSAVIPSDRSDGPIDFAGHVEVAKLLDHVGLAAV